jgi:hypothetical protein
MQLSTTKFCVVTGVLLLSSVPTCYCQTYRGSASTVDEVVARMYVRDRQRENLIGGYAGSRRYTLDNRRMHKHAELLASVKCDADGTKHFEVLAEQGWQPANKHVLRKMLESETEASRPQTRPSTRLTPENYVFQMVERGSLEGRPAYVIEVVPKRHDKYLFQGRIWVDAEDYALMRAEGKPSKSISFWTRSVHFVHTYHKSGPVWFPLSTESVTEVRIFGTTEVTIDYYDYAPNLPPRARTAAMQAPCGDQRASPSDTDYANHQPDSPSPCP